MYTSRLNYLRLFIYNPSKLLLESLSSQNTKYLNSSKDVDNVTLITHESWLGNYCISHFLSNRIKGHIYNYVISVTLMYYKQKYMPIMCQSLCDVKQKMH